MPIRYFLASLIVSVALACAIWVGLPPDVSAESPGAQAVPPPTEPTVAASRPVAKPPAVVPESDAAPTEGPPLPMDLGGEALARVVSPASAFHLTSLPLPAEATTGDPPAHALHASLSVAVALPKPAHERSRAVPLRPSAVKPLAPPERVPFTLTAWAGEPQKPLLPAGPGVRAKARDVAVPPRPPVLGRPPVDRPPAPTDDPTGDAGNEAMVNRPQIVQLVAAAFVRVGIPDPFALAAQVRDRLDPASEPGLTPVPVSPRRPGK